MTDQAGKDVNPFQAAIKSEGALIPVEQQRAVQEVQAAMIIAKKFPRDQHAAYSRIMAACERSSLAGAATYSYPKGGAMVTGPSIRLAEVMAQNWGNMEFGIRELSQESGFSEVQAFAWDMETNVKQSKTFRVPHKMKARGSFKTLTDPRDIYEHVANMGARRLRACVLGVIPGDIVDAAVGKCEETLTKGDGKPIEDRVRDMLERFKEIEISQELIEGRLQHKTTAIVRSQLVELGKIYNSIKDGMSKSSDWFDVPKSQQSAEASDLTAAIQKKTAEKDEVEQKEQKETIDINCPYCKADIKTVIITMMESGAKTFTCSACQKEGKIENGLPVGIYPVDETGSNEQTALKCDYPGCDFTTTSERGMKSHKTRSGHEKAPDPEDALRDELEKIPVEIRVDAEKQLSFKITELGRPMNEPELKELLEKCNELIELSKMSPEGQELIAVNAEINNYHMGTVERAQGNLELPTNRVLGLDESNLLLLECQRVTQQGEEDLS